MSLFKREAKDKRPMISVIKNESPADMIMWTHPDEDFNTESILIVEPNEEVLFIESGQVRGKYSEAGRYNLETSNVPLIRSWREKSTGGVSPFPAKIIFFRKEHALELKWGTDTPIQVRDPVYHLATQIQARGSYSIKIRDCAIFYTKMAGNVLCVDRSYIRDQFKSITSEKVKVLLANYIQSSNIEILGICSQQSEVASALKKSLYTYMGEYGIELVDLFVDALDIPKDDPNRAKLDEIYVQKSELGILGDDWARVKQHDVLSKLASNEGVGNAAMVMGMGQFSNPTNMSEMFKQTSSQSCCKCGASLPDGSKFCSHCGSSQAIASAPVIVVSNKCPNCSSDVVSGSKFCSNCGSQMEIRCACGEVVPAGSKFCPNCGTKV